MLVEQKLASLLQTAQILRKIFHLLAANNEYTRHEEMAIFA